MAQEQQEKPKIHIDSDWKAQAQAEKERLKEQEKKRDAAASQRGLPEATMATLIDVLASQAMMGLGALGDSKTGRMVVDLEGAKFNIDLLQTLEEKTRGNLSDEEANHLSQILNELRTRFVQIVQLVARQSAQDPGVAEPKDAPSRENPAIESP